MVLESMPYGIPLYEDCRCILIVLKAFVLNVFLIDLSSHISPPWRYFGDVAGKS